MKKRALDKWVGFCALLMLAGCASTGTQTAGGAGQSGAPSADRADTESAGSTAAAQTADGHTGGGPEAEAGQAGTGQAGTVDGADGGGLEWPSDREGADGADADRIDADGSRTDGAEADGTGAEGSGAQGGDAAEQAAGGDRRRTGLRETLLGERANYRFTIRAPSDFESEIRSSTLVGRWQNRTDYDPVQFEGLVGKLRDEVLAIAQARGHFSPVIDIETREGEVTVNLQPGPLTRVSALDIRIEGAANDNRALNNVRRRFGMAVGDPFISSRWQSGKNALVDAMEAQGYLRARITRSSTQVDARTGRASLVMVIDSGPRIAFGDLVIQGLERYPSRIIEDLRTFKPGDPFDEQQLLQFQERLREAGYFNSASALPDLLALREDGNLAAVPIQVVVEEMQRHRMVYGLGYSTDDGFRGQVGFQDRNLFGLQMEAAVVLSQRRQRAFSNFRTPYDAHNRYYGFGGRVERESANNITSLRSNVYVGYGRRERDIDAFTSLQYQVEEDHFRSTGARDGLKALVVGKAWTLSRFDSDLNPSRGYGMKFEISGASRRVLSDRTFTRYYTSLIGFKPLPARSVLRNGTVVARVELGAVNAGSRDGIPSDNLFFAGGTQSLRGYGYRALGLNVDNQVVGMRYLAIGSLEYQHRLTETFSAVAFYDYGNVSDSWRAFDPVSGYGAGVQMKTPVGPVRLDVAYGQLRHRYRLHFTIGFSF